MRSIGEARLAANGKALTIQRRCTQRRMIMPAQRPAEILGTPMHAQLTRTISNTDTVHPLLGIGSWQRQLIAVTCIAEHA